MNEIKKNLHKLSYFLLLLFVCVIMLPLAAAAEQAKVVRVGWYEDSFNITGEHGERSGYGYEYQQSVAAHTGWQYEYVKAGWSELLKMLQNGEIDLMSGVSYTDERAQHMLFSDLPMSMEKYFLYADLAHTDISAADLATLNGKRVGLLAGSIHSTYFYKWEAEHNLHLERVFITGFEDGKQKLAQHQIDCIVSTETPQLVELGLSAIVGVGESGSYFVINKNRPDLKIELDNAMRKIAQDKPFYIDELYKKYLSAVSSPLLANDEKQWLAQHGKIRIGCLKHDVGFSDFDAQDNKMVGVINDYLKFAADCLGQQSLDFELVSFASQDEVMQALKNNEIDMIFHFSQNPYLAEENGFVLTDTVLTANVAVVTAKKYFDENTANSVAIEANNTLLKWYLSYNYPKWEIREYATLADMERAVLNGQADCFIVSRGMLAKYMEDSKLHSVFLTKPASTAFAVNRGNTVLLSILNKTLKAMPATMLSGALSMYESNMKKVTVMDFVKDNLLAVAMVCTCAFLLILGIILSLLRKSKIAEAKAKEAARHSQELNKKLQDSHAELQKALQQAEDASAAKTTFLFNMSHDIRTPMNVILGYAKLMQEELKEPKLLAYQEKMVQAGNLLLSIINNVLDMARIESGTMELDENYSRVGDVLGGLCEVFEVDAAKKNIKLVHEAHVEHEHIMCDVIKMQEVFSNLISNAIKYTPAGGTITLYTQELPADKEGYVRIKSDIIDTGIGMSKDFLPEIFDTFSRERNTTMGKVAGTGLGMAIVKKLVEMMGGTIEVESELGKGSKFSVTLQHRIADAAYYAKKEDAAKELAQKEILKGKHILLAEDNDLNAEIAVFLLEKMGMQVERVEDGVQCVSKMEAMPAGTFDLILMDIQMPNMDGYKATQAIRRFPDQAKAKIPIVAMTANAFEEDRQKALAQGMNGHIAKPIDVAKVEKILAAVLQ